MRMGLLIYGYIRDISIPPYGYVWEDRQEKGSAQMEKAAGAFEKLRVLTGSTGKDKT